MNKLAIHTGTGVSSAPYSPGVLSGNLLFISGQIPVDPATGQLAEGDFSERVRQCIRNLERVLEKADTNMEQVVKTTVFLTNMEDFGRMNAVYGEYFGDIKPARSCVQVAALPLGVDVEIEAIAVLPAPQG
jgi:2-iminobutanoate/2-iminopropanoate deaminase